MNTSHSDKRPAAKKAIVAFLLICLAASGCTLLKSNEDIKSAQGSTVVIGHITGDFPVDGPIVVAARSLDGGNTIVHYSVLHEFGEYELMVAQGRYTVFAYIDRNRNLVCDPGEPAGQYGDPSPVRAPAVGVVYDINFSIPATGSKIAVPTGTRIAPEKHETFYSRQAGAIVNLDDERFDAENGVKGFWEPTTFFKQFGGNIYFLEPYDPEKTPIVFIHGATGTPRGWRYIVDHLDRSRFQPWFYYYPSGSRIDSMAYLLLWKLSNLQSRYHFHNLYITAHSMGGLVARSFIVNHSPQFPYVSLFISLATPWGGDRMAEYGVEQSPVVIPSWIDMQPEGDFIQSLYRSRLPEGVAFYMFSGHRGSRNPFRSNNDGTIALSSLLDYRPQSEAKMNYSFNEDHDSILLSKDVVAQYNSVLEAFDKQQHASTPETGGYLRVRFSYDGDFAGVQPRPVFLLRPKGWTAADTVTHLSADGESVLGPFPAGDYLASMATMAGRTTARFVPVSIESHETKTLDFVFVPDGEILGCLTAPLATQDRYVGQPDYRYRSADKAITIQSIDLEGEGIHRTPSPATGPDIGGYDHLVSRNDVCYNTCFGFFGLPAGEYTLSIRAQGYRPLEKTYAIVPGKPTYFRATELTPE